MSSDDLSLFAASDESQAAGEGDLDQPLLTGTKSRIFFDTKVQGLPLPKEV